MDEILLGIKDIFVGLVLGVALLHFPIRLWMLVEFFQRHQGIVVGLLKVSVFELCICNFSKDLIIGITLFNSALVVFDTSIMFLGQEEYVAIVLDLIE